METRNIQPFRQTGKSSLIDLASQKSSRKNSLSGDEQRMINKAFDRKNVSLNLYGGSGKVRTEQPDARGSNIDITV